MSLKHRLDTQEGVNELTMQLKGERIEWVRRSPTLRRTLTIYLDTLTPQQKERLAQIEQELLAMAYDADEETTTKTVLKGQKRDIDTLLSTAMPRIEPVIQSIKSTASDIAKLLPPEEEKP